MTDCTHEYIARYLLDHSDDMTHPTPLHASWKLLLLVVALLVGGQHLWALFYLERSASPELAGTLGAGWAPPDADYRLPIMALSPTSPLALAGARVGDRVAFERYGDTWRKLGTDEELRLTLYSGTRVMPLTIRPTPEPAVVAHPIEQQTIAWVKWLIGAVTLSFGLMIGLRRADNVGMRVLALSLIAVAVNLHVGILPSGPMQDWTVRLLWPLAYYVAFLGFPYFTLNMPEERPLLRIRWVRYGFGLFAVAWTAMLMWDWLAFSRLLPWNVRNLTPSIDWETCLDFGTVIVSTLASWFAWRRSTGEARQRMAWIGFCLGTTYFVFTSDNITALFNVDIDRLTSSLVGVTLLLLAYSGLGYAILRHRVFNFGFAVNRALVFSFISTMLLLSFAVTEWVVDKLLHFEGREKNVIFDALVALGIILSFHRIQHWVSHRIDHTFFHHWYEAAARLRQFVEQAAHITYPDALQTKFLKAVQAFVGVGGCALYLRAEDGRFLLSQSTFADARALLDADDDTLIALRHKRAMVELAADGPDAMARLAFPMMVRGHLSGMLLVGPKLSDASFRPDEIALIASSTLSVGLDLESLRVEGLERQASSLIQENAALKLGLNAVRAVAEMPELKQSLQSSGA
jgi:hypothetical protein